MILEGTATCFQKHGMNMLSVGECLFQISMVSRTCQKFLKCCSYSNARGFSNSLCGKYL